MTMKITTRVLAALALLVVLSPGLSWAHGKGHVLGTIAAVAADHLDVTTTDKTTVTVKLTKETRYFEGEAAADASAARVGLRVVVHLANDGSAAEVHLPKAEPRPRTQSSIAGAEGRSATR